MGRTSTARERLLDAACELMQARSYGTVGVAEVCARADVRKGSFYHFFPSKQELTLAAIDLHWGRQRTDWAAALATSGRPLARLERLFALNAETQSAVHASSGTVHGCALANLALELGGEDHVVRGRLREVFEEQVDMVRRVLHEAADEGAIPDTSADTGTARALVAQLEGMILFAKLANDPAIVADAWANALRILGPSRRRPPPAHPARHR